MCCNTFARLRLGSCRRGVRIYECQPSLLLHLPAARTGIVVAAIPLTISHVVVAVRSADNQRAIQPECQERFGRQPDLSAARHRLPDSARARASGRANGSSFAAASNSADDASDQSATADILTGTFVHANPFFA